MWYKISTHKRIQNGTRSIELVTMSEIIQTQYINRHIMAIMAEKLVGGSYCNSTTQVSFLQEKAMSMSQKNNIFTSLVTTVAH